MLQQTYNMSNIRNGRRNHRGFVRSMFGHTIVVEIAHSGKRKAKEREQHLPIASWYWTRSLECDQTLLRVSRDPARRQSIYMDSYRFTSMPSSALPDQKWGKGQPRGLPRGLMHGEPGFVSVKCGV